MADPIVWGLLPKAQDNPQTIDEAIAAAIAAHEADPDAHLGDGESLESHRANDTIDHPAGSVLGDKWTMTEFDFTTYFESLSGMFPTGNVTQIFPGVEIDSNVSGDAGRSQLVLDFESAGLVFNPAKTFLFQFVFNADTGSDGFLRLNFGYAEYSYGRRGIGLEVSGGTATFYATDSDGANDETLSWPSYGPEILTYIVRMQYLEGDDHISVFINGELLGTLDWPIDAGDTNTAGMYFMTKKPTTSQPVLNLKSVYAIIPTEL